MRKNSKKIAIASGTVAALTVGGVAFAYWTTSGDGEGTASTRPGNGDALSVTQVSVLNPMYPGDSAQGINFTVKNEGNESYKAQAVKGYLTVAQAANATGSCSSADYLLDGVAGTTAQAPADLTFTATELVAGASAGGSTDIQFNNLATNQDGCKGATVTIHYVAS